MSEEIESAPNNLPEEMSLAGLPEVNTPVLASTPFSIDLTFNTLQGVLSLMAESLRIEWRIYDMFDQPQGGLQSLVIPLDELVAVDFRKRWLGGMLRIIVSSASSISDLPLPAGNLTEIPCSIKKRNRNLAALLAAEAGIRIAER
jgi:hypothetical protein